MADSIFGGLEEMATGAYNALEHTERAGVDFAAAEMHTTEAAYHHLASAADQIVGDYDGRDYHEGEAATQMDLGLMNAMASEHRLGDAYDDIVGQ